MDNGVEEKRVDGMRKERVDGWRKDGYVMILNDDTVYHLEYAITLEI